MTLFVQKLKRLIPLLFDMRAVSAIISWPKFSITAYGIVSDLKRQGIRPRTVIDVGANEGQFTVAVANFFKGVKVYAFEPLPICADRLHANTAKLANIEIFVTALGSKNEKADFYINSYSLASSLLRLRAGIGDQLASLKEAGSILVDVTSLDSYLTKFDMLNPVLLKIDVQGAEKMVVEGGQETLKHVDYVLLETSFTPMYVGEPTFLELIDVMKRQNFNFSRPVSFLKSPKNGEILQADILFQRADTQSEIP